MALGDVDPRLLAAHTAVLATNGPDGRPRLSAMWFLVEDDRVRMSTTSDTGRCRNLERDPHATVLWFDPGTTGRYVEVRGEVVVDDDADLGFADRLGNVYGVDMRSFDPPDVRRVRLTLVAATVDVVDVRDDAGEAAGHLPPS